MRKTADCPACYKPTMRRPVESNPMSKYHYVRICDKCARHELAAGNFWVDARDKRRRKQIRSEARPYIMGPDGVKHYQSDT